MFLLLENLDRKKPFGIDTVHPFLLSVGALEITKPLTHLINLSLTQGKFPDSLKIAKVAPVFKQGSHMLCTNYCPISVLPALSKIFEKCMLNQLISFFIFFFTKKKVTKITIQQLKSQGLIHDTLIN